MLLSIAVLAPFTDAEISAGHSTLVALTVLLQTSRFLAVTTLGMESLHLFDLRLEGIRVPVQNCINGHLPIFVFFNIGAVKTVAFRTTSLSESEAVAVQFETPGFLAVTDDFA